MRRDQTVDLKCLRGSGLPNPVKGSSETDSIKLKIFSALLLSFLDHQIKSCRNFRLKMILRLNNQVLQTVMGDF